MLESLAGAGDKYGELTDVICLGDLIEGTAGSVHADEHEHTLMDEYEHAAEYLEAVMEVVPHGCRLHWTLGNHCSNVVVNDCRRTDKAVRENLQWSLSPWAGGFNRWAQYPYRKPNIHDQEGACIIGQCVFTHGWDAGQRSDRNESMQIQWAIGGWSHRLFCRGHTHLPKQVEQVMFTPTTPASTWFCNAGTMGPLRPSYCDRKWTLWEPALIWGECQDHHRPSRFPGKCWDAHVEVLQGAK